MRTTIEFAPSLMRAAKARSAELGESLKTLLTRAVAAELGRRPARLAGTRLDLPVFGSVSGAGVNPSNADLERALANADAALVPTPRQTESRRRTRPATRRTRAPK